MTRFWSRRYNLLCSVIHALKERSNFVAMAEYRSSQTSLDDMPHELLAKIFSRLPVHRILQLRCVCKLWKSIISSHATFPLLWSKHSLPEAPWILMYSSRDAVAAFNPSAGLWVTLPIPSPPGFSPHKRIVASSSGLLCFCISCESCRLLFVCNPITKECRILPDVPLQQENFLTVMFADNSGGYRIYVAESFDRDAADGGTLQAAVYSSADDSWCFMNVKDLHFIEGCGGDSNAFHAGMILSVSKGGPPHQLTIYNPMEELCTSLQLPFERSLSLYPPLCVGSGRLFLAGGVWEYLPFSSLNLWELDPMSRKFVQVESILCADLDDSCIAPLPSNILKQLGTEDFLFFHARMLLCPLMYSIRQKSWTCMPRYYGPCKTWAPAIMYEPSFAANV